MFKVHRFRIPFLRALPAGDCSVTQLHSTLLVHHRSLGLLRLRGNEAYQSRRSREGPRALPVLARGWQRRNGTACQGRNSTPRWWRPTAVHGIPPYA